MCDSALALCIVNQGSLAFHSVEYYLGALFGHSVWFWLILYLSLVLDVFGLPSVIYQLVIHLVYHTVASHSHDVSLLVSWAFSALWMFVIHVMTYLTDDFIHDCNSSWKIMKYLFQCVFSKCMSIKHSDFYLSFIWVPGRPGVEVCIWVNLLAYMLWWAAPPGFA